MALIKIEPYIIDTTGDFTFNNVTATGNLSSLNADLGNTATANFFSGSGNNLSNIAGSNVSGQVGNALVSGTVYTNAQPNITSVGTLTGITSTGTADLTGASNVALGPVANVHITGGTNGYVLQTDGSGTLSWVAQSGGGGGASISNGNSNVNIPSANGNINFTAVGNTVMVITGTGANISGTANVTGNLSAGNIIAGNGSGGNITNANVISANTFIASGNITAGNADLGNLAIANFFSGAGNNLSNIQGSNVTGAVSFATTANSVAGANVSGQVSNALVSGTVYTNAQPNITSVGTLTDLSISGNGVFGGNLTVNGTLTYINSTTLSISDPIINLQTGPNGAAPVANTGKDVGTALNYYDTSAKIAWMGWDISNAEIAFGSNVGISSEVVTFTELANIRSGNASLGNNVSANFFTGNGIYLTGITTAGLSNGNSNVNIPSANGNINFSAVGNANVVVITGTGANISGTANVTGNLSAGNITAGAGSGGSITGGNLLSANYITGTLTTNAQPNITSVGSLTSLTVTGNITGANANLGNLATANYFIGNFYGTANSATTAGTVTTNAQPNITSVGSLTGLTVSNATGIVDFTTTANVTLGAVANLHIAGGSNGQYLQTDGSGTLTWSTVISGSTSNISNGNSNVSIPVANGNINFSAVGNANVVVITGTGANISGTANVTGNLVAGNITAGAGSGGSITGGNLVSANYFTGTLTTNAQPNITSVGSLTGLTVSNATGIVDFTTTANVTLGSVGNLHISGGTNGYVLSTDGSGTLSWVAQSGGGGGASISNGNSNVNIPAANGNINFSAVGNANVVVVTGTGVNVAGTLNVTGQSNLGAVGNVIITGGTANYVLQTDGAGNLDWVAQSGGNAANVTVDNFTGNGVQTIFTLSTTPIGINQTSVNYNGATVLRTDYTLANANITFSSAPANGSYIEVTTINLTAGGASSAAAVGYSLIFGG
jgi:hypothetical protein